MRIPDFKVEQWMNDHEGQARYNLTDTCSKSMTWQDLLSMQDLQPSLTMDYGSITGSSDVKREILSFYTSGSEENITTFHGCLEANLHVMMALLEPGDHVLTFSPGYQQFVDIPRSLGCRVDVLSLHAPDWQPIIEEVEASLYDQTKMVILNNPNNPTGTLYSSSFLEKLIELCRDRQIYILCDEVYRGLREQPSISDLYEYGISTASLSKVLSLAGLRYGWVKANREIIDRLNVLRDYSMISTGPLLDGLAASVLAKKEKILAQNRVRIDKNIAFIQLWLKDHPQFHCVLPKAGTVCFLGYDHPLDSQTFALDCLEQTGAFFVPGACFGYENYLRLGLGNDHEQTKKGLELVARWCDQRFG